MSVQLCHTLKETYCEQTKPWCTCSGMQYKAEGCQCATFLQAKLVYPSRWYILVGPACCPSIGWLAGYSLSSALYATTQAFYQLLIQQTKTELLQIIPRFPWTFVDTLSRHNSEITNQFRLHRLINKPKNKGQFFFFSHRNPHASAWREGLQSVLSLETRYTYTEVYYYIFTD